MLHNPGTKDSSNPIAINGRFKGKHQCFVVQLANIGLIQKVFLDNIHDIQVAFWLMIFSRSNSSLQIESIKITPNRGKATLLTHIIQSGVQMLVMKEYKERALATLRDNLLFWTFFSQFSWDLKWNRIDYAYM